MGIIPAVGQAFRQADRLIPAVDLAIPAGKLFDSGSGLRFPAVGGAIPADKTAHSGSKPYFPAIIPAGNQVFPAVTRVFSGGTPPQSKPK